MKCPYCASEVSEEANVCPHCTRDVYPFKPFIERIIVLEEKINLLCEAKGDQGKTDLDISLGTLANSPISVDESDTRQAWPHPPLKWFSLLVAPLALLLLTHLLITQLWDTSEWVIYLASIAIPLVPGYLLTRRYRCSLYIACAMGTTLATLAVTGMLANTSILDAVPFFPRDAREWKELANFLLSIAFSYLSGAILGQVLHNRTHTQIERLKLLANPAFAKNINVEVIQNSMDRLDSLAKSALAVLVSFASLYSGLGRFFGS